MSAAVTLETRTVPGSDFLQPANIVGDAVYPTGGYPLTPKTFGLNMIRRLITLRPRDVASAAYIPVALVTVGNLGSITAINLALVVATTGLQVAAGTNVSAASFHVIVEGN